MGLAKRHDREGLLHAVALRGTTAFVGALLRSMPFWRGCVSASPAEGVAWFERVARLSQKGTRLAQAVIADGKARGDARLAAAAPSARKGMEALVVGATALVARAAGGANASFGVGNLKHRDVQGRVVSSQQAYESSSSESESDEESESESENEDDGDGGDGEGGRSRKKNKASTNAAASAAVDDGAGSGGEEEEETAEEDNEEEEAEEDADDE
jgi:Fanconi anemia group D2 protein